MRVPDRIFREYDIRGVWGVDLTEETVRAIGRAFAVCLREQFPETPGLTISIGRDVRTSSPAMLEALTGALLESGIGVVDIGICPTPLQYFSLFRLPVQGGLMITASHNPAEFNGLKLSLGTATIYGEKIQQIKRYIEEGRRIGGDGGSGSLGTSEIIPDYIGYMRGQFTAFSGIKAVLDAGNGVAGIVAPALFKEFGAETVLLYCDPDGRFPNHHPDPVVVENIKDLISTVRSEKADLGIGYDGDGDRIGVVDNDGEIIWGDRLLALFARDLLLRHPGATIIGEVKCSQGLYDDIEAHGGRPVMWKTGHSLIKGKMKESGALLAGEMSGHIFFKDRYFGYDDAIYASLRLMEALKRNGPPYSIKRLLSGLPRLHSTPEIRIDCPDDRKFAVVEGIRELMRKDHPIIDIDGVRIRYPEGWGLVRASNTQPALVLRFEADSEEALERIRGDVEGRLRGLL
ncbi:MAG: phosphomannomutase/phosphoglucomutase [Nitrospiraceae bacterium]|nr:phosphomannomutase/phosphoglucomutase [Nitrospiraceae bacterium]